MEMATNIETKPEFEIMELSGCEKMVLGSIYEYQRKNDVAPDLVSLVELVNTKFDKNWKMQTVCTFLTRMEKKGLITIERRKRSSRYIPVLSREDYIRQAFEEMSKLYFNDNMKK